MTENLPDNRREQPRIDLEAKVRGRALFTDDLSLPRMLYGKLKRSTLAHGRLQRIETSQARQMPGVLAVITGQDLPNEYGILPVTQDETALAIDKVRYAGEPVAALCALDERTAQQAIAAIEVSCDPLPPILSVEEALKTNVRVHDSDRFVGNAHRVIALEFGDVEGELLQCDYVREDLFFYSGNTHLPMEPHAVLSSFEQGRLTVYVSHQAPYYLRQILAKALSLEVKNIRTVVPYVGGGFGGKLDPFPEIVCSAKLSMITGRPVKITLTREEVFYNHRGRHPSLCYIKTGLKKGRLAAMHVQSFLDGGAAGSFGVACAYYHGALQPTTYQIPHYKVETVRAYTNKAPCGPKRGHGTPQPRFALECHLDKIAEDLQLDPVTFRLQNLIEPHSLTINQLQVTSCGLKECLTRVVAASSFGQGALPWGQGLGLAVGAYVSGAAVPIYWNELPQSEVMLKADRSGAISAYSGHTEIGQGSDMVLATLVAQTLGIEPEEVHLVLRDSDAVPPDLGSYSSRVTLMMGNAALQAAKKLREILEEAATERLGVERESLIFAGGKVYSRHDPQKCLPLQDLIRLAEAKHGLLVTAGSYTPPTPVAKYKGSGVGTSPAYSFSACVVRVEVDRRTGLVYPKKVWLAHDIGHCINKTAVEGQIEGGIYMGLGEALWEETVYTREGLQTHLDFLSYKTPTAADLPEIETMLVESAESEGPCGAKEVGQGPLLPVIPALVNAVHAAIGIRFDEIPLTPDKVLMALERGQQRVGPTRKPDFTFPEPVRVTVAL